MIEIYGTVDECVATDLLLHPYPELLYQIPMQGELTIDESFESPVTGSFNFVTTYEYEEEVRVRLCAGTYLTMFGFAFRVSGSPQIEEIRATEQPDRIIAVSISLDSCHLWINEPVPLVLDRFAYKDNIEKCEGRTGGIGANNPQRAEKLSLNDIAWRAGGSYSGPYGYKEIPNDVNRLESTTFESELQPWLRVFGGFVRYSNPAAVEVIGWRNTPEWKIGERDIISNIRTSYQGVRWQNWDNQNTGWEQDICQNELLPQNVFPWPVPILKDENQTTIPYGFHLYPKAKLEFQDPTKQSSSNADEVRAEWQFRQRVLSVEVQGEDAPLMPQVSKMKDLSIQDGSYAKTKITTYSIDGMPAKEEKITYDFFGVLGYQLFGAKRVFTGAAPQWDIKEHTTKIYTYDQDGYELGWIETGYRMGRFKEESATEPETAALNLTINAALIDLYRWKAIPIISQKGNLLEPHFIYYSDERFNVDPQYLPPWEIVEVCLPSGEHRYINIENKGWIEPRFVLASATYTNNFSYKENPLYSPKSPENLQTRYLTTGEEGYTKEETKINYSKNTQNGVRTTPNMAGGLYGSVEKADSFTTFQQEADAQGGDNFKSARREAQQNNSEGRPATAPHLPPTWERIEPPPTNGQDASLSSPLEYEYFAETAHLPPPGAKRWPHLVGSTRSYEKAKSWQEAQRALQTEADIEESRNAINMSFTILSPCLDWRVGDRLLVTINGIRRKRRILGISRKFTIDGISQLNNNNVNTQLVVKSGGTDLQLGLDRPIDLIFSKNRKPINQSTNPLERFFVRDTKTRGVLPVPQSQSRLQF
jgi:hypothetical protein